MPNPPWKKVTGVGNQILIKIIENKKNGIYTFVQYFYGLIILSWLDSKGF
jgi:hypothetical protein